MSVAVAFPGQGSQSVGMGLDLKECAGMTDLIRKTDEILGYSLSDIMFNGPADLLTLTENTQPALLLHSFLLWSLISDRVNPSFFAGHSLGEYTALTAAGGIDMYDAVLAVHNRGKFMQNAVPVGIGGMAAVLGAEDNIVEAACREVSQPGSIVEPANYNADGQIVVSGHMAAIELFTQVIKERGARRVVPLSVSAPFHCSLMKPAQDKMSGYLSKVNISRLRVPVVSNVYAVSETEPQDVRNALEIQMSGAVKWSQSVKYMAANGVDTIIEVGAGSVLTGLVKKIDKNIKCINISSVADIEKVG